MANVVRWRRLDRLLLLRCGWMRQSASLLLKLALLAPLFWAYLARATHRRRLTAGRMNGWLQPALPPSCSAATRRRYAELTALRRYFSATALGVAVWTRFLCFAPLCLVSPLSLCALSLSHSRWALAHFLSTGAARRVVGRWRARSINGRSSCAARAPAPAERALFASAPAPATWMWALVAISVGDARRRLSLMVLLSGEQLSVLHLAKPG